MDVPDGGPIPTSITIETPNGFELTGEPYEVTEPVEKFDEAFGFKIKTFSNSAEFRQKISAINPSFTVNGVVTFMACNNATCSPPKDVEFSISIADGTGPVAAVSETSDIPESGSKSGLLKFFIISLLAGFAGVFGLDA